MGETETETATSISLYFSEKFNFQFSKVVRTWSNNTQTHTPKSQRLQGALGFTSPNTEGTTESTPQAKQPFAGAHL